MYIYFLLVWEPIFDWRYKFNPLNFVFFNQAKSTLLSFTRGPNQNLRQIGPVEITTLYIQITFVETQLCMDTKLSL